MRTIDTVWVAEAYKDGERIEQLVHINYGDAKEDIEITTRSDDPDDITFTEKRLYRGKDAKRELVLK